MSDRMMSVDEWRSAMRAIRPTDTHITMKRADVERASRTVVHQAEQIERLQAALEHAMYYSAESISDLIQSGIITDEDLEAPE